MGKIFFISDTEFGNRYTLKENNRPFKTTEEMDEALIEKWNNKVSAEDEVYIVGDFAHRNCRNVEQILDRLNGVKYLITGEHDQYIRNRNVAKKFKWIKEGYTLKYKGYAIVLYHFPMFTWYGKENGYLHLFGHIRNSNEHDLYYVPRAYNVGADVNNLEPQEIEDIFTELKLAI